MTEQQITELKQQLDEINAVKEKWYEKKEALAEQIRERIEKIKQDREKRNSRTNEVREVKKARDTLNNQIKKLSQDLQSLRAKKEELFKKHDIKGNPTSNQKEIDRLEEQLETSVMSFEKEKKMNKLIRTLKAQMKGTEEVRSTLNQIREKTTQLRELRKQAKEKHKDVQSKATESQERHESLISSSEEVDTLRKEEEAAFAEFMKHKDHFNEINSKLKEILSKSGMEKKKGAAERKRRRVESDKKELAQKERSVEEKIKKREKLTTEDLLVFQKD